MLDVIEYFIEYFDMYYYLFVPWDFHNTAWVILGLIWYLNKLNTKYVRKNYTTIFNQDPKYITCRRYKRVQAKSGQQVCLYKGANDTYQLVVEGQCPIEYQCKYNPHGQEPNIDSVVDSLNDSFKKK